MSTVCSIEGGVEQKGIRVIELSNKIGDKIINKTVNLGGNVDGAVSSSQIYAVIQQIRIVF